MFTFILICFIAIAFVVGGVLGYLMNQKELEEVRKTLLDTKIELRNVQLGYKYGDKNI